MSKESYYAKLVQHHAYLLDVIGAEALKSLYKDVSGTLKSRANNVEVPVKGYEQLLNGWESIKDSSGENFRAVILDTLAEFIVPDHHLSLMVTPSSDNNHDDATFSRALNSENQEDTIFILPACNRQNDDSKNDGGKNDGSKNYERMVSAKKLPVRRRRHQDIFPASNGENDDSKNERTVEDQEKKGKRPMITQEEEDIPSAKRLKTHSLPPLSVPLSAPTEPLSAPTEPLSAPLSDSNPNWIFLLTRTVNKETDVLNFQTSKSFLSDNETAILDGPRNGGKRPEINVDFVERSGTIKRVALSRFSIKLKGKGGMNSYKYSILNWGHIASTNGVREGAKVSLWYLRRKEGSLCLMIEI